MKAPRDITFFIPHTKKSNYESAYETMKSTIKYQMGGTIAERRIESLTYASGKKKFTAKVGEFGQIEHRYEVVAIMEAALYNIVTKSKTGEAGPTILVDPKDVLEICDFKVKAEKPKAELSPAV